MEVISYFIIFYENNYLSFLKFIKKPLQKILLTLVFGLSHDKYYFTFNGIKLIFMYKDKRKSLYDYTSYILYELFF